MNRREFLTCAVAAWASRAAGSADTEKWRTFEITTRIDIRSGGAPTRVWVPMPLAVAPYQKTLGDTYQVPGGATTMVESEDVDILVANWDAGVEPSITITNRVATTSHAANLATPTVPPPLDMRPFERFLHTGSASAEAAVKQRADGITRGAGTDIERARAIFAALTDRRASADESANVNATFAALSRTSGIPAREVWGIRADAEQATRAQSLRAEVYLTGYGWVPVDASDRAFGSWTTPWIAYNWARNVVLPGAKHGPVPYLAHPQAETGGARIDAQDPDAFRYSIVIREVTLGSGVGR